MASDDNNYNSERRTDNQKFREDVRKGQTDIILKMGLLEKDVSLNSANVDKLDETCAVLKDLNININSLLQKHETNIIANSADIKESAALTEQRRAAREAETKELHTRITHVGQDLKDQINDFKDSLKTLIDQKIQDHRPVDDDLINRVRKLEIWKWVLMGGGIVVGFILTKLPVLLAVTSAIGRAGG